MSESPKRKRGRPPRTDGPLRVQLTVRATDQWMDWLRELAESEGIEVPSLLEKLLLDHARERGFRVMPNRTGGKP